MSPRRNAPLSQLRQTLTTPPAPHLDDAQLAELATAEALGEPLETLYPQEIFHLETCVRCAEAYADLLELTLPAFEAMTASVSPREGYLALLLRELRARLGNLPGLPEFAQTLTHALPQHFPTAPTAADFTDTFLKQLPLPPNLPPAPLLALLRDNLRALTLYLQGTADALWGTPAHPALENVKPWGKLHLTLTPAPIIPTLADTRPAGDTWTLARTRTESPLPLNLTLHAQRLSPLACRLEIVLDRPGLFDPAGRTVELHYAGQTLTAQTDPHGRATFTPIPIAALPELEIRFQT
jgi:hypothetical protein